MGRRPSGGSCASGPSSPSSRSTAIRSRLRPPKRGTPISHTSPASATTWLASRPPSSSKAETFKTAADVARTVNGMNVLFISSFAPIVTDESATKRLYVDTFGLDLEDTDGYLHSEKVDGVRHF